MSGYGLPLAPLLMLAACSSTAEIPDNAPPPVVQEEVLPSEQAAEPAHKPTPAAPQERPKLKADVLCPPVEGETHRRLMIRKLDCLIELYERDRK